MLVKAPVRKDALIAEGIYEAVVASIKGTPDELAPKKILGGFKISGREDIINKEWLPSLEIESPLRKDVESIRGKEMTASEAENGIDLATLVGKACKVVVTHKASAGGKLVAAVCVVLPIQQ